MKKIYRVATGCLGVMMLITGSLPVSAASDPDWTDIGNARFMDGWVLPALGYNQTLPENQYDVPLQQSNVNPNVYRLVDPYHIGPAADKNTSTTVGHIMFDVSDPEHVIFLMADAGFADKTNSKLDFFAFYCYNTLGQYLEWFPEYTAEELIKKLGDGAPWTTFKDGVVSLGFIYEKDGVRYDANFGFNFIVQGGMDWPMYFGSSWNGTMVASITFPEGWSAGVETVERNDAEAEYYTLQGVKVLHPEKGQFVIEKRGSTTRKIKM